MKKRLITLLVSLLLLITLCACGSSGKYADDGSYYSSGSSGANYSNSAYYEDVAESESYSGSSSGQTTGELRDPRKIIYTASARIDTIDFDNSYTALTDLVKQYGGYVQDSYLSAGNYYSSVSRSLEMTVRIPAENYEAFLSQKESMGRVVYFNESTQDVTGEYIDISARIETLKAQEERLMQLISQAKNLEEMLLLEDKLSDVRYQIESAQSRINVYDDLISYCTVTVTLNEVEKASNVNTGFGYKLGQAFISSWAGFINAVQDIVIALVSVLPVLIIGGIAAFFIIKAIRKRGRQMPARFVASPSAVPEDTKAETEEKQ